LKKETLGILKKSYPKTPVIHLIYPRNCLTIKARALGERLHRLFLRKRKRLQICIQVPSNALTAASFIPGADTFTNPASLPVDHARGESFEAED